MIDIDLFVSRLLQTIDWTSKLSQEFDFQNGFYGLVFRQTNPVLNNMDFYKMQGDYACWNLDDYDIVNYQNALQAVINQRDYNRCKSTLSGEKIYDLGRILCFTPFLTTHDGMAIADSKCFVDESDVPPIDTWFYLEENFLDRNRPTLFCWIPKLFEPVMKMAIDTEIMESYHWLDETAPNTYRRIFTKLN